MCSHICQAGLFDRILDRESLARYAYTVKTLGQRIRERREELDLSLREFAKQLGCSPPFVSDVEYGRRFPSSDMLGEMARVLKLDIEELKAHDPRPPLDEIRRMAERDPRYAMAFRTLVEKNYTADELQRLVSSKRKGPRKPQEK